MNALKQPLATDIQALSYIGIIIRTYWCCVDFLFFIVTY